MRGTSGRRTRWTSALLVLAPPPPPPPGPQTVTPTPAVPDTPQCRLVADMPDNAAVTRGYHEFLARKTALTTSGDPVQDLMEGWDDYVAFARERPRLYAAMTARLLSGAHIPAAEQARLVQLLVERVTVGPTGADIKLRVEGL